MPPQSLAISRIGPESDILLRNLFDVDTEADGSYSYDTASVWAGAHEVYLARVGESIAGFAVIGSAADWLGDIGARDVHEFFCPPQVPAARLG